MNAFIASSSVEVSVGIARAIRAELATRLTCHLWEQGVFKLSHDFLSDLNHQVKASDFAIIVFGPDDKVTTDAEEESQIFLPRDNVLFELGLFVGHLGIERTFIVVPKSTQESRIRVLSDLSGRSVGTFVLPDVHSHNELRGAVAPLCDEMYDRIKSLGERRTEQNLTRNLEIEGELGEYDIWKNLQGIKDALQQAVKHKDAVFHKWMNHDLAKWRAFNITPWAQGTYVSRRDYNEVLLDFYERAERLVFSTCLPEYLHVWQSDFGQSLLAAHARSKARVTRVFIFDRPEQVTAEHISALRHHNGGERVESLIYFDQEVEEMVLPVAFSKDFTVIDDGDAIGVTQRFDQGELEAKWYIKNDEHRVVVRQVSNALRKRSRPLGAWLESR